MLTVYQPKLPDPRFIFYVVLFCLAWMIIWVTLVRAEPIILTASWYSIESLKREGTWKFSKGVMANGEKFDDNLMVCATRLFPLGSILRIQNLANKKSVIVVVKDRIGKRFGTKRIDLSKAAFQKISRLEHGIIKVSVEVVK